MPDNGNDTIPLSSYPGAISPYTTPWNIPGQYSPSGNGPAPDYYALTHPAAATSGAAGAPGTPGAAVSPPGTSSTLGPDITLGPDGNVYGYARNWDSKANGGSGGYTYTYSNLGPATNLAAVSQASGIPTYMLQPAIMQQGQTLQNLVAQGAINPYVPGGMTNSQLQNALDAVRNAQSYLNAEAMNTIDPATGITYGQEQNTTDQQNAAFQYANQGTMNQSALANANTNLAQYQSQQQNSGINGMTYAQLGNLNQQGQQTQQYNYNQNYNAANPYSGMTNGQTSLQQSNASDAASLQRSQLALGQSAYSGGQNRIAYEQGIQDKQDAYNQAQSEYQLQHQANQNALNTYNEANKGIQAANTVSKTTTGLGFAGITRPQTQGFG